MTAINILKKYGTDTNKELGGVPFYIDKENDSYILVARYTGRNTAFQKANAELTKRLEEIGADETANSEYLDVFIKHLIKGWNNIADENDQPIEFTTENALRLLKQTPDLLDELYAFALDRENYRIFDIVKN